MPGLVPGIHVSRCLRKKDVDGRDKPGHDGSESLFRLLAAAEEARRCSGQTLRMTPVLVPAYFSVFVSASENASSVRSSRSGVTDT
jgi:hypothetical protein